MLNLKEIFTNYHSSARAFQELVPWMCMVDRDLVLNNDGSLLATYRFNGVDSEGMNPIDKDRYTNLVEQGLRVCDSHMTIWGTVDRRRVYEYPESVFENEISQRVDGYYRQKFVGGQQYENKHFLTFKYSPAGGSDGFFEAVASHLRTKQKGIMSAIFDSAASLLSKKKVMEAHFQQLESMRMAFAAKLREFEETVAELSFKRFEGDDLLSFLHTRCSPANPNQTVTMPKTPVYLNTYLPDNLMQREFDYLKFHDAEGDCYVMGASVKWPAYSQPGPLDALLSVPGEITISQCFRFVDNDKAKKYMDDHERHLRAQSKSLVTMMTEQVTGKESDQVNLGMLELADAAQEATMELTVNGRTHGYYSMTVLAYGATPDESSETLKLASSAVRSRDYVLTKESMHLLSLFTGTIVGQDASLVRWAFINIANVADLALIRTMGVGDKKCEHLSSQLGRNLDALTIVQTENATPYYFDPYKEHLAHTLVVGPSRSGKSAYMNFVLSQFGKYTPCNRFIFDKDKSCRIPTLLQGGSHLNMDIRDGARPKLNPIALVSELKHRVWLMKWMKSLAVLRGYEWQADDDEHVRKALDKVANQPREEHRLSSVVAAITDRTLKSQFAEWVGEGTYASFFDNVEDEFDLSDFVCIELGGLLGQDPASPFMDYAFLRIHDKLDGRPTVIYVEECWFMLKDPEFAAKLDDWLRTLAKKNAFVMMATQSLQEISTSEIFHSIIDNIKNRIYLPNPDAMAHYDLYTSKFGLNKAQVERIITAVPKRNYYIVTSSMSRMAQVVLPKEILAVMRSDTKAQKLFDKWYERREEVETWKEHYLEEVVL